jgi:branched-chain amino acid aminotransferase
MAAIHAAKHHFGDCLVLNSFGNVCEATIANVFTIKGKHVLTPALSEGCVAGVMRRYLLHKLPGLGFSVQEGHLPVADLSGADEIFLSNAVSGTRWVQQFENRTYGYAATEHIFNALCRNVE